MTNNKVKIGWLSDSQIGYQQYGLLKRRQDFASAYLNTIQDMIGNGVDFILHTGDLLNTNRPSPEDVEVLKQGERMLVKANRLMLVVSGNHDGYGKNWAEIAKNETDGWVGYKMVDTRDGDPIEVCGLQIQGLPFMAASEAKKILPNLQGDILLLHQAVKDFIGFPSENALSLDELPQKNFQLIAMGDIHINDVRILQSGCVVGYPGSTELCSETESERKVWKEFTFCEGRLELTGMVDHPIDTREVVRLTINTQDQLDAALQSLTDRHLGYELHDIRKPSIFCEYAYNIPKVVERFKAALDPDDYILRLSPSFAKKSENGEPSQEEIPDNLTLEDIRKSMVPQDSKIFDISSKLLNSGIESDEANAALDQWIEKRLAETTCAPAA